MFNFMSNMKIEIISLMLLTSFFCGAQTVKSKLPQLGKDPIDKIVASMTLEEKAALLVGDHEFDKYKTGQIVDLVPGVAGTTVAIPRFGIPISLETDGPAGVNIDATRKGENKTYYCTGFPIATLLASTWNSSIVEEVGRAMGNEVLEYGCDVLLAPAINLHRNPLCGRNFEYYSEDPYLVGKTAAAMIKGVQSQGVGTSLKHFAANNQETFRRQNDSRISQRALRELYLKGFEIAVKESQPWTVMSSYNKINGTYTQESYPLLTTILRDEWGFKGIVMSDWTRQLRNTAAQIHAGNELLMPGFPEQITDIENLVKSGKLPMKDVDICVKRMLQFLMKTPHFRNYAYSNSPDLKAHALVARKAADEGIILLKNNNNVLPLSKTLKDVALFGIASYNFVAGGTGSGDVNKAYVVNVKQGLENVGLNVEADIRSLYDGVKSEIEISPSYAKLRAKDSDMAVITLQRNSGEYADRHNTAGDFYLTEVEKNMLKNVSEAFHEAGKKVVVVLNIGGVIETASWKDYADAIILAWQPGVEGGNCVADIMTGKINPSGKLATTFPVDYMDVPSSKNFPYNYDGEKFDANLKNIGHTDYEEDIWVGYRYFNTYKKEVSFPFGFGMSYTTFGYENARIKRLGNEFIVTVDITNTGKMAGKEVVELFVSAPKGELEKPACELKAYAKTKELRPNEKETVTMKFNIADLASFNEKTNGWITDSGVYKILISSSVETVKQSLPLKVNKSLERKVMTRI